MDIARLAILGIVIGSNNLAAALALGALGQIERRWRIIIVFGLFEFTIPLAGIWLGRSLTRFISEQASWISTAALAGLGIWIIYTALRRERDEEALAERITTWQGLFLLAAGLSIDNLIIGISLGLGGMEPLLLAATIAAFSIAFTWLGLRLGNASRRNWEKIAEVGSGVLLLALAFASLMGWL